MRTTRFSFCAAVCAVGVDVVALFTPAVLLFIADEFSVSLVVALFTFVAVTLGLFAAVLMLFKAIFETCTNWLRFLLMCVCDGCLGR